MLDKTLIGRKFSPYTAYVEEGRLRLFARAVGETNPIYTDIQQAIAAGYHALPALPTFVWCLTQEGPDANQWMDLIGVDFSRVLHGSQSIDFHRRVFAGDTLTYKSHIADIYHKKNNTLGFVVEECAVTNQNGEDVSTMRTTGIVLLDGA